MGRSPSSYDLPESLCPSCGINADCCGVEEVEEWDAPKPGSFSICLNCTAINVFTDDLMLRSASQEEFENLIKERPYVVDLLRKLSLVRSRVEEGDAVNVAAGKIVDFINHYLMETEHFSSHDIIPALAMVLAWGFADIFYLPDHEKVLEGFEALISDMRNEVRVSLDKSEEKDDDTSKGDH